MVVAFNITTYELIVVFNTHLLTGATEWRVLFPYLLNFQHHTSLQSDLSRAWTLQNRRQTYYVSNNFRPYISRSSNGGGVISPFTSILIPKKPRRNLKQAIPFPVSLCPKSTQRLTAGWWKRPCHCRLGEKQACRRGWSNSISSSTPGDSV